MCVQTSDTGLRSGLSLDEIEKRLVASARRHHREERAMAYWLHEVARRSLFEKRGFSSIGDYARELLEIQPRKAQYLVFIASRLEKLPKIALAFDAEEISWTKAREIVRVATPETEDEWLERATALSSRDLEREVRRREGRGSGEYATLTISIPVELLAMWNDCYELAERLSAAELDRWQVLEPMMAEFLGTFLPAEHEYGPSPHETEQEIELSPDGRRAVLERDGYRCVVPGCTMRRMLDVHHLCFRSQGGGDAPSNLVTICRIHHGLVHKGICSLSGTAPDGLKFERPQLFSEGSEKRVKSPEAPAAPPAEPLDEVQPVKEAEPMDEACDWREETVAEIFDSGPPPRLERPRKEFGDLILEWLEHKREEERVESARGRRSSLERLRSRRDGAFDEHVFAGREPRVHDETVFPDARSPRNSAGPEPSG